MADNHVFERYELKYRLSEAQYDALTAALEPHVHPDRYFASTIGSLYYDTPDRRLIRRSLERPVYKEKLRLRSYGAVGEQDNVFVELKKKYDHVTYKRRETLPYGEARRYLSTGQLAEPRDTQILREIAYFRRQYPQLAPAMLLAYDRLAYVANDDPALRITFDRNVRFREQELSLTDVTTGESLIPGEYLLEIKTDAALPLWLLKLLEAQHLYRSSFSKYGAAFRLVTQRSRTEPFLTLLSSRS